VETRTPGAASGPGKRARGNTGTAPRTDSTVRREAQWFERRWETYVADPVAAGRRSWGQPDPGGAGKGGSSP